MEGEGRGREGQDDSNEARHRLTSPSSGIHMRSN